MTVEQTTLAHIDSIPNDVERQNDGLGLIQKQGQAVNDIDSGAKTREQHHKLIDTLADQQGVIDDLNTKLDQVKETLRNTKQMLEQERLDHDKKMQETSNTMDRLRVRVTEAASKSAEMPSQSPLRRPESEIIKDWQGLTYDVRNLVMNYFKGIKDAKIMSWAKTQGHYLQEVTPYYMHVAADNKCTAALIEAAIWNTLARLVFGDSAANGAMCWAGRYFGKLSKLSSELFQDITRMESEKQIALFHQWKALTASVVSGVCSQQDRNEKIADVADELEDMLEPFRSKLSLTSFQRELQNIVRNAVALDESFCGQQAWYRLVWPPGGRHDVDLHQGSMKIIGGGAKTRLVRFVVQPCLCRAGGGRGESYNNFILLDEYHVWMY
ncbi:hypothetical protein B0J13DRAFT_500752 [Dactylonectria estremocensis]|uniref:Uncharacterized protein n=1 Tax=Dactylonectria estremocensis TaxID=1079267 RepID=A0A9P9J882_9HYPO|nr:hypothetical protein B0J13DRAFT_500752 [Dactylonectria estremocensis]